MQPGLGVPEDIWPGIPGSGDKAENFYYGSGEAT